jgi:GTP cyclohydrolase IA
MKTDAALGIQVNKHLEEKGLHTPMSYPADHPFLTKDSDEGKMEAIEGHMRKVMAELGLDLSDDSLIDTPRRIAKMFVQEIFSGLKSDTFPKVTTVENKMSYGDLIIEKCTAKSVCEHHFVYFGTAHNTGELGCWIAYIPKDKVLGLSKLNRITNYFARRPQIQERLTGQIAEALKYILETDDVAVVMRAQHFCVLTRGVEDADSNTTTSSLHGRFMAEASLRSELMALVNKG